MIINTNLKDLKKNYQQIDDTFYNLLDYLTNIMHDVWCEWDEAKTTTSKRRWRCWWWCFVQFYRDFKWKNTLYYLYLYLLRIFFSLSKKRVQVLYNKYKNKSQTHFTFTPWKKTEKKEKKIPILVSHKFFLVLIVNVKAVVNLIVLVVLSPSYFFTLHSQKWSSMMK